ncbi:ferredoxin [Candidatus Woesearchaeota archaeon]|nr:ferredoxin [Candidatus Woesearchaeota archaeon]
MTYKIIYNQKECIGAGECERLSPRWKVGNNGRAQLQGSIPNKNGEFELEIPDEEFKVQKQIAGSCPVGCIRIEKCK